MSDIKQHSSHKDILLRLKRAHGHLAKVINMIEEEEGCLKISQQLFAVEKAITQAKKNLIHDHFEDISKKSSKHDLTEFKEITKYL
jgi:DNA-binding FrmR family transcriptional regulator